MDSILFSVSIPLSLPYFENILVTPNNRSSKVIIIGICSAMQLSNVDLLWGCSLMDHTTLEKVITNNLKWWSFSKLEKLSYFHFPHNWVLVLLEIHGTAPGKPCWSLFWNLLCIPMSMSTKSEFLNRSYSQFLMWIALNSGNIIFFLAQSGW